MPNTIEQTIFSQVMTNLLTISIDNGFSFDIGGKVDEWRDVPHEDESLPAIDVRDPTNIGDEEEEEFRRYEIEVTLFDAGSASPASVREKAQDVLDAFKLIRNMPEVEAVIFLNSEKEIDRSARSFSAVTLRFAVLYHTEYFEI